MFKDIYDVGTTITGNEGWTTSDDGIIKEKLMIRMVAIWYRRKSNMTDELMMISTILMFYCFGTRLSWRYCQHHHYVEEH